MKSERGLKVGCKTNRRVLRGWREGNRGKGSKEEA